MKPTDLTLKFALLAERLKNQMHTTLGAMDLGTMQAIPALYVMGSQLRVFETQQIHDRLNDELLEHYDLLNGVTPVTKLFSRLNNVDDVMKAEAKRLMALPQQYQPLRKLTVEDLKTANFEITFNQDYLPCQSYQPHSLLTGLIPTTLKPQWGDKTPGLVDIVDIFEVNKEAFTADHEAFHQTLSLENDRALRMRFTPTTKRNNADSVEMSWQVECEIHDLPAKPDQHWKVRTFFNVVWNGEYVYVSPFTGPVRPGQLSIIARELMLFSGNNAVRTPYDIHPPLHYELSDPLSTVVEVYNELENTIHFGIDSLIPKEAIRAGLRAFLRRQHYHPVTPSKWLDKKEVTLALLDAIKSDDGKSVYHLRKKNSGEYIQYSTYFHCALASEEKRNGIWKVQIDYSKLQHLFAPETIDCVSGYLDLRGGHNTIEVGIMVLGDEEPQLVMNSQHLTLRSLNSLLGVITKLNKLLKDESASQ